MPVDFFAAILRLLLTSSWPSKTHGHKPLIADLLILLAYLLTVYEDCIFSEACSCKLRTNHIIY